jgi:sulfur-oxidizing protein SoxY
MRKATPDGALTRRRVLRAGLLLPIAAISIAPHQSVAAVNESETGEEELIKRLIGEAAAESGRVRLDIPPVFANGHSVPMTVSVDSPMTESDYVSKIYVLAPRNPILSVARFQFTPHSGRAAVSARIRLAEPQNVLAIAQMSGGEALMARAWVEVEENGCPSN